MSDFKIHILGCGSATPSLRHQPSCQVVSYHEKLFMIDCGEGAQLSMRYNHLKYSRLTNIFISHLHGDHCLGLPGLLSTMSLQEMGAAITVYTFPEGVKIFSEIMNFFCGDRTYDLKFKPIKPESAIVYEDRSLTVETFPLYHRIPCVGYIFRERPKLRHIIREMIDFYNIPVSSIPDIKAGADYVTPDGRIIENNRLTTAAQPSLSYAYCSDTMYDTRVAEAVRGVDVIYHEATYTDDKANKAHTRGHSTATEAAKIAVAAGAKVLILGHFSKMYTDEDLHLAEARKYADENGRPDLQIIIAKEGLTIDIE